MELWDTMSPLTCTLLLVLVASAMAATSQQDPDYKGDLKKQLEQAELFCLFLMNTTSPPSNGSYCSMVWDNVACWPYTANGSESSQPCPTYIHDFDPNKMATRRCQPNGTWYLNPEYPENTGGWSNYTPCFKSQQRNHPATKAVMENIRMISKCGYAISLVSLILAIIVMLAFKKLHCKRNTIHINLFLSFALRAVVCLIKEFVTVGGSFLPMDVFYDDVLSLHFRQDISHWQCKLFYTIMFYTLAANYMHIFVEGLFLHTVIFVAVFSQKKFYLYFIIFGWVAPITFAIPWVLVRIFLDDTLCWNTDDHNYYWIQKFFIVASICVNFFFFLNIIRVLFTKLMSTNAPDPRRYRKLAKSTLILIPLFGVHYIIFICIPDTTTDSSQELTKPEQFKLYVEMTLNSFQGLLVAVLFCFLNGEVRSEVRKKWRRHRLRRASATSRPSATMTTGLFFASPRDQSTRDSISHQVALIDIHHPAPPSPHTPSPHGTREALSNGDAVTPLNGTPRPPALPAWREEEDPWERRASWVEGGGGREVSWGEGEGGEEEIWGEGKGPDIAIQDEWEETPMLDS